MSDDDPFDWSTIEHLVIQRELQAVAIYSNPNGDIVIRQSQREYETAECFIVVAKEKAIAAAYAVLEAAGLDMEIVQRCETGGYVNVARPERAAAENTSATPKDKTAAERMRRHRAKKKRNGHRNDRNGHDHQDEERMLI
jgi:hypothetical protein